MMTAPLPPEIEGSVLTELIVACVRTGNKYGFEYVERLQRMVAKHLSPYPHHFVCLTEQAFTHPQIGCVLIGQHRLPGWWGKMALFAPTYRRTKRVLYFDLDTVICGDLKPMAELTIKQEAFAVCANFTRRAGHPTWPCTYGSCAMVIDDTWRAELVWSEWSKRSEKLMNECGRYGDQLALEKIDPHAVLLQDVLPKGFFLGRRDLGAHSKAPPKGASVVVFGGSSRPHNSKLKWVRDIWEGR